MDKSLQSNMLAYCKTILTKVSFDRVLFQKEYDKCISYLTTDEAQLLKVWVEELLHPNGDHSQFNSEFAA